MKTTYTKEEFIEKFDSPKRKLRYFFEHMDRFTTNLERENSRPDFFRFFGIDKAAITEDNDTFYAIPFEVAPLLSGMIHAFFLAYGNDRRGLPKNKAASFGYERYHKYIAEMQKYISQLEPYQQVLIKNYRAYHHAYVIDAFLPMLIDKIATFLSLLLCYGGEQTGDTIIGAIHGFDWMIEDLTKCHLKQQHPELPTKSSYTFENAIARVFAILAGQKVDPADPDDVISVEMENYMIDEINSSKDIYNSESNEGNSDSENNEESNDSENNEDGSNSESDDVWSVENIRELITRSLNLQYRIYYL